MRDTNIVLLSVIIGAALLSIAAAYSEKWLRNAAAHLIARAEGLSAGRRAKRDGYASWRVRLGADVVEAPKRPAMGKWD